MNRLVPPPRSAPAANGHRLPPHSMEAERGVLACALIDPLGSIPRIAEHFLDDDAVFYDLRHRILWDTLRAMYAETQPVDAITLIARLKTAQNLDLAGGIEYLADLPEATSGASNLLSYLQIVWEKYLAREAVADATGTVADIYERDGFTEGLLQKVHRTAEAFRLKTERHIALPPRELVTPLHFEAALRAEWFHGDRVEIKGWRLPFELADFRIRPHEFTLLGGDSETGKSTWLSEVAIVLMKQGIKCAIASMEMPAAKLLRVMTRQVLGLHRMEETPENEKRLWRAVGLLEKHLWIYDNLGIAQWPSILDAFAYAYDKLGVQFFILDNAGMIGIDDDDLAGQGRAAASFAIFAHRRPVHLVVVQHVAKSETGGFKQRLRGNKRWTDLSDNAIEWQRNEKKRDALAELEAKKEIGEILGDEYATKLQELLPKWDAKINLRKQRWGEGERRNASRYLWYDWQSKQFRDKPNLEAMDYLL